MVSLRVHQHLSGAYLCYHLLALMNGPVRPHARTRCTVQTNIAKPCYLFGFASSAHAQGQTTCQNLNGQCRSSNPAAHF